MAIYKRDIASINLETGTIHRTFLNHSIGYKDQKADHFGIRVFRDGEPVDLTGVSVQGVFMPPQGNPIAITSGNIVSGNEAEVVLPQACYNYDGQFCLAIKLVDSNNSVTGTMRIVDGMVDNTHASGTVAPTSAVPTYQEILSTYDAMVAATAAANGAIASTYSSSSTYNVGDYCIHDGGLYRCTTAITTAEAWTSGHWTAAKIGPDVSDLKSAIANTIIGSGNLEQGQFTGSGGKASSTKRIRLICPFFATKGTMLRFSIGSLYWIIWEMSSNSVSGGNVITAIDWNQNATYTVQNDCWVMMAFATASSSSSSSAIDVSDFADCSVIIDPMDAYYSKDNILSHDNEIRILNNFVNYGYDENTKLKIGTAKAERIGIIRNLNTFILNGTNDVNYNLRIKISNNVSRAYQESVAQSWSNPITLEAGHSYLVTTTFIDGVARNANDEQITYVTTVIYKSGQSSSIGTILYSGNTYKRYFTAQENTTYHVAYYIPRGYAYTNAKFVTTLEDVTELKSNVNTNEYKELGMSELILPFEQGTLSASGESDDNTRIREVGYLELTNDIIAVCDEGYQVALRIYVYDGTNYTDNGAIGWASKIETERNLVSGTHIRFCLKKSDDSDIVPEEMNHLKVFGFNSGTNAYFDNPLFHNVCHRGFNTVAPENTIPAFAYARKVGFRFIETDVQFTASDTDNPLGMPVILHDRSINRTGRNADGTAISGTVNIDSITYTQALTYDFGIYKNAIYAGTKLPTFAEMIKWCKYSGVRPYIELKTDVAYTQDQIDLLVSIADSYGILDQCTWISFGIDVLGYVHQSYAKARIGYLVRNKITATNVSDLLALRSINEVFFLPYNSSHNVDTTTFPLALAEGIKIEACIIDDNTLFASMDKTYSGNVTNGYPTSRKMWEESMS